MTLETVTLLYNFRCLKRTVVLFFGEMWNWIFNLIDPNLLK